MRRIDLHLRIVDQDNEQLVLEATTTGAVIAVTPGHVELTDAQLRELRNHIDLILETEH